VIGAYRTGLHVVLRWADRNDWGSHRYRRIQLLGFVPATDWRFPSWDPVLRAAVYTEAVAVTSLVLSPYWAGVAADPRERRRFYDEAARRLQLPDYHPDGAYDPLAQWASRHADFGKGNTTTLPESLGPPASSSTSDGEGAATAARRPVQRHSRRPAASPWSGKVTPATSTLARALDARLGPEDAADRSDTGASQGGVGSRATTANTRRFYRSDLADFEGYCLEQQLPVRLPIPPAAIAAYLSACAQLRPAPSFATLMRRLSAICKVHELNGYAGVDNPGRHRDLWPLRRDLRRQLAWPKQQTGPTTAADIRRMVQACPPQRFIGLRDRAMLLLGYVLLTASELVALDVEDLQLVDQGLVVVVPRPKPGPDGSRFRVVAVLYLQQRETCPVRAWLAWQEATGLHTGPAFRPVHPRARPNSPDVLALRATIQAGPRLGTHCIDRLLKRAAQRAGLPDWQRYGIHSQRRGAAIELHRQGASDFEIAQAGGWRLDQVRQFAKTARIPDIWHDPEAGRLGL
jgi:integrase